jgi:phosphoenolpyruvate synthase/pyruvate phosphate dikinase
MRGPAGWRDIIVDSAGRPLDFAGSHNGVDLDDLRLGWSIDTEWCIDHEGRLHVLQARPITTASQASIVTRRLIA